jgi:hypothetical protein
MKVRFCSAGTAALSYPPTTAMISVAPPSDITRSTDERFDIFDQQPARQRTFNVKFTSHDLSRLQM